MSKQRYKDADFRTIFHDAPDAYLIMSATDGTIQECNKAAERMLRGTHEQIIGLRPDEVSPQTQPNGMTSLDAAKAKIKQAMQKGHAVFDWVHRRFDGEDFWVEVQVFTATLGEDENVLLVGWREIGVRKALEREKEHLRHDLLFQANTDALTGLKNRRALEKFIEDYANADLKREKHFYVYYVDLDNFKGINDAFGHHVGDAFLTAVSKRLKHVGSAYDFIARIGGDEFIVIIDDFRKRDLKEFVAEFLLTIFDKPVEAEGREIFLSASIGIAEYPKHGDTFAELIRSADAALYKAKGEGRGGYQVFNETLALDAMQPLMIESNLKYAIKRKELRLYYQPQFSLETGALVGIEALVRWNHPEEGLLGPGSFLPIAEKTALIKEIEAWIFHEGCHQAKVWHSNGYKFGRLALNASGPSLSNQYVSGHLRAAMAKSHCPAEILEVEISESFETYNIESGLDEITMIKGAGVSISLDDYGTAYSSLKMLAEMPLDVIKIDRSLIMGIGKDQKSNALVVATIGLCKLLNFKVIAEGVEHKEQMDFLRKAGCNAVQGYLCGKPVSKDEFEALYFNDKVDHLMVV